MARTISSPAAGWRRTTSHSSARERAGLVEDLLRHRELAQVVQGAGHLELGQRRPGQPQAAPHGDGQVRDLARMAADGPVLGGDRLEDGADRGVRRGPLEAAGGLGEGVGAGDHQRPQQRPDRRHHGVLVRPRAGRPVDALGGEDGLGDDRRGEAHRQRHPHADDREHDEQDRVGRLEAPVARQQGRRGADQHARGRQRDRRRGPRPPARRGHQGGEDAVPEAAALAEVDQATGRRAPDRRGDPRRGRHGGGGGPRRPGAHVSPPSARIPPRAPDRCPCAGPWPSRRS